MENILDVKWIEILDAVIRSLLSLTTLFLVTKMLGKKQVSQLSVFDYVIGISIGNFAAEMTINTESHYLIGITAVVMFGLIAYLISILTMKNITLRRYFIGVPTILIQRGKILENNLKEVKFDINDLLEQCRINGYFDTSEIEFAVLESNGTLSILPKGDYKPLTPKDMNLKTKKQGICINVIIDGKIMKTNLKSSGKDQEWLEHEISVKGKNLEEILLATIDVDDKLLLYERNKNVKALDAFE